MVEGQSCVVNEISLHASERAANYRFMNNDKASIEELIHLSTRIAPEVVKGSELLVLVDSTAVSFPNYNADNESAGHGHTPLMGHAGGSGTPGFYLHPGLVIDESAETVLGLSDIVQYSTLPQGKSPAENNRIRTGRQKLPFEQKASSVWSLVVANSQAQLASAKRVTYVMDRGADSYEVMAHLLKNPDLGLIVRSKHDRKTRCRTTGQESTLSDILAACPWVDARTVKIRALNHMSKTSGKQVQRAARSTTLHVRYSQIELQPPRSYAKAGGSLLLKMPLYVVEVQEADQALSDGEPPVHWRLITSRTVNCPEEAWRIVDAYQKRWYIEQLFRVLKKQGLAIGKSQFKDDKAIVKQSILALKAATEVMQLTLARQCEKTPIQTLFTPSQIQCMKALLPSLEGRTRKQQNPHPENMLAWAAWAIARLGGWKGYAASRPPGPITFSRGLDKFYTIFWAFKTIHGP